MSLHYFGPDDLFTNRVKTYPDYKFFVYNTSIYVNNFVNISGSHGPNILNVPNGYVSLYELNINRGANKIYPFVLASSERLTMKSNLKNPLVKEYSIANSGNLDVQGSYQMPTSGSIISGSYPLSASLTRQLTTLSTVQIGNFMPPAPPPVQYILNLTASALANAARNYSALSKHFIFSPTGSIRNNGYSQGFMYSQTSNAGAFGANTTYLTRDLLAQEINMIFVPQIFCGSSIKKGSVNLKFYITGSLLAECADVNQNGELIQTTSSFTSTGEVVGLVMYNEGIIMLTSSVDLEEVGSPFNIKYAGASAAVKPSSWKYFAAGLNDGITYDTTIRSASFAVDFKGTNYVNTMTMFCHAKKGDLNHSNNPTYRNLTGVQAIPDVTSSHFAFAEREYGIKNIVSSSYVGTSETFSKTTYISKIALYDKNGNMIGVASTATPIKKTEDLGLTFKLKLDI